MDETRYLIPVENGHPEDFTLPEGKECNIRIGNLWVNIRSHPQSAEVFLRPVAHWDTVLDAAYATFNEYDAPE